MEYDYWLCRQREGKRGEVGPSSGISLTFAIKLKTGFFKTQPFFLTISQGRIILESLEDPIQGRIIIGEEDLESVCLIRRRNPATVELEIMTVFGSYVAGLSESVSCEELTRAFNEEFGCRLVQKDG